MNGKCLWSANPESPPITGYRNKGYDFTITSSTAYDHKWIYGRNIFDSIARIVDELFENYLSRPNVRQPILTQYCDGRQVQCRDRGWMTQWGSKSLGDQGYSAIEILRYFYGNDMYINVAEEISGIPASWPGYDLDIGASGDKIRQLQEQLNTIAGDYPALPKITVDGIYGQNTKNAVKKFQSVFGLPATGITDYLTWYKIQEIYVAVSRIAELNGWKRGCRLCEKGAKPVPEMADCGLCCNFFNFFKKSVDFLFGIWYSITCREGEQKKSYEMRYAEVSELADEQD